MEESGEYNVVVDLMVCWYGVCSTFNSDRRRLRGSPENHEYLKSFQADWPGQSRIGYIVSVQEKERNPRSFRGPGRSLPSRRSLTPVAQKPVVKVKERRCNPRTARSNRSHMETRGGVHSTKWPDHKATYIRTIVLQEHASLCFVCVQAETYWECLLIERRQIHQI